MALIVAVAVKEKDNVCAGVLPSVFGDCGGANVDLNGVPSCGY